MDNLRPRFGGLLDSGLRLREDAQPCKAGCKVACKMEKVGLLQYVLYFP